MDDAENARLAELVEELDRLVPRDNAVVKFEQRGGGPDESRMVGTRNGYLRLGVEFLRAVVHPNPSDIGTNDLRTDTDYLVSEQSDLWFDTITLSDDLTHDAPPQKPRRADKIKESLAAIGCAAIALFLVSVFVRGLVSLFAGH